MSKAIKNVGERGLLDFFEKLVDLGDLPFNDDAVAFPLSPEKSMVVNIDTFVSQTDAPPNMTYYQMGAKAVVMAISDLAAKGVQPQYIITSCSFPETLEIKKAIELVNAIKDTAHKYEAKFLGGDTNAATELSVSVVALGEIKREKILIRKGAKEGDIICTTGEFGLTGAGFKVFLEKMNATIKQREKFEEAVFYPKARVKEGLVLSNYGKITSCIDSSDGLAWCLKEILRGKNEMGIKIDNIPIANETQEFALEKELFPEHLALYGGEEFELVFTLREEYLEELQKQIACYRIGRITKENPGKILMKQGREFIEIKPTGWEHFT